MKRLWLSCVLLTMSSSAFGQTLEDGLVGWWPFDEGQGIFAADASPSMLEGTISNGNWVKGDFGTALKLGGQNSFVSFPALAGLDGSAEMSISTWVYWEGTGRYPNILQAGWNPGGFMIFVVDNTCSFRMGRPGHRAGVAGEQWREISAPLVSPLPMKQWVHLAVSFTRPVITTYVNGTQVARVNWDEPVGTSGRFQVGRWSGACHNGLVDELRIYKRALNAAEVTALARPDGRESEVYQMSDNKVETTELLRLETRCAVMSIGENGMIMSLKQKAFAGAPERELLGTHCPLIRAVLKDGRELTARALRLEPGGLLAADFPRGLGSIKVRVVAKPEYVTFNAEDVTVKDVETLHFCQVMPAVSTYVGTMSGMASDDDSGVCLRSLSLRVAMSRSSNPVKLSVNTESAHGLTGSSAALVAGPRSELVPMLKQVELNEPVPKSVHGGPWACESEATRGSYLFANLTTSTTDEWIAMAHRGGFEYIHLHGWWKTLGHYDLNRGRYPNGIAGMKRTVEKIHAAGMKATCHTLTACIDPRDSWVTPVPSDDLIAKATYTLAKPFAPGDTVLYVNEKPVDGHEIVWSYSCNGNAIKIGKEIIRYTEISHAPPYAFKNCERGVFGTKVTGHEAGAKADYLQQRYIAFYPKPDSQLADDLADAIANVYNTVGLDGIYFDGSEGMRSRYGVDTMRWKIFERLKGGGITEASQWGHNSWWFHSRLGAWDHPVWAMRRNHDAHVVQSLRFRKADLVQPQLGWWAPRGPTPRARGHFPDEMEYFGAKNLSLDGPMSIQGVSTTGRPWNARIGEMFTILGWYERMRMARYFVEEDTAVLGEPKKDFRLRMNDRGIWQLTPMNLDQHRISAVGNGSENWTARNPYAEQAFRARVEALYSVNPADDGSSSVLADFSDLATINDKRSAGGVTRKLSVEKDDVRGGVKNLRIVATNTGTSANGAWTYVGTNYPHPYHSMKGGQALGLWIKGDGSGALLNVQVQTPYVYHGAVSDHYVDLDFTGWRYVELLLRERDADRMGDYKWPYSTSAASHANCRNAINISKLSSVRVYLNAIPAGGNVDVVISPILALTQRKINVSDMALTVNGKRMVLPVKMQSGHYLELEGVENCAHYDERGELVKRFVATCPDGMPVLKSGENSLSFAGEGPEGIHLRADVAVLSLDKPFGRRSENVDWKVLSSDYDVPRIITTEDGKDNVWTIKRRDEGGASPSDKARLELELEVVSAGTNEAAYSNPASILLDACSTPEGYQQGGRNNYAQFAFDSENQGTAKPGVTFSVEKVASEKSADGGLRFTATSVRTDTAGWAAIGRRFEQPVDISSASGIGLWLKGDGSGASFKVQLRDVEGKWHDMVTPVSFNDWQFLEFQLAGAKLDLSKIEYILYYYNGLPASRTIANVTTTGRPVACIVDGVKAMRDSARLNSPVLTINGQSVTFPVDLYSGSSLTCRDQVNWTVHGINGQQVASGKVTNPFPVLKAGANQAKLTFNTKDSGEFRVTVNTMKRY
ncbi:MAG: hypothetical protein HN742_27100 [Lentisphaerae bacterium]|nr:hypothetical protein [Lentisphaerota bacterium]MBT4816711.1 hypothetical protein [Lentisphaerota bacterium]MBT5607848.1 hypothetical protein [Lentisphaerota bacterium]MBT7054830.1 hypothetical protein [Lentisphaerota bacterium]MBT7845570.1 hypothetical protein [Lentisphaerota bacterium]